MHSGTGASCIYPLLGCQISSSWSFVATGRATHIRPMLVLSVCPPEIDPFSYDCASDNVASNGLQSRIHLHKVTSLEPILSPLLGSDTFDFTMCNPPFYSSREEMEKSAAEKEFSPSAVCTGTDTEIITPGGESAFVRQMVTESLIHKTAVKRNQHPLPNQAPNIFPRPKGSFGIRPKWDLGGVNKSQVIL